MNLIHSGENLQMADKETRQKATVQDDTRETQIALHCGLQRSEKRLGPDAFDNKQNPFELKSATKSGVTTGRDIGIHTIGAYRKVYWIIAEGSNYRTSSGTKTFEIRSLYIAHPEDLESWFSKIESRIESELEKCEIVLAAAEASGVNAEIVRFCRDKLARGVTINNPKIPMQLIRQAATSLDPSNPQKARRQLRQFVRKRPLRKDPYTMPSVEYELSE